MSAEYDLVTIVTNVAILGFGVATAISAAKSASASKDSAEVAAKVLHRSAVRDLVAACHGVIAEELRIQSLVTELKSEYSSLGVFTGSTGGSRQVLFEKQLDRDLSDAADQTKEAKSLLEDPTGLVTATDNDLDLKRVKIEASRVKLQTIREAMARQVESVRSQNQQYREPKK
jgi:hypothetical protein